MGTVATNLITLLDDFVQYQLPNMNTGMEQSKRITNEIKMKRVLDMLTKYKD
jgi:hypothetical protein